MCLYARFRTAFLSCSKNEAVSPRTERRYTALDLDAALAYTQIASTPTPAYKYHRARPAVQDCEPNLRLHAAGNTLQRMKWCTSRMFCYPFGWRTATFTCIKRYNDNWSAGSAFNLCSTEKVPFFLYYAATSPLISGWWDRYLSWPSNTTIVQGRKSG